MGEELYFSDRKGEFSLRMVYPIALCCAFSCLALFAATPALAETCSVSMQNVAFGNVNVTPGTPVDTSATLQITCSAIGSFDGHEVICVNIGAAAADDATSRRMTGPSSATIRYNLYSDAARTTLWGSWASGYQSPGVQMSVVNGTTNQTVYARLLGSQQSASLGTYTSTFTAIPSIQYFTSGGGNCPFGSFVGTASTSFTSTATVIPSCTVSVTSMSFGSQGLLTSNVDATSTVSVNCSNSATYNVSLGNGNTGTGPIARKLVSGASNVTYGIY
jgi:spore coat protein U-like protein